MVYEANARLRDPVYGCAGAICQLQKQVSELQAQLAKAQAEVVNMQYQQANLVALICMEMSPDQSPQASPQQQQQQQQYSFDNFITTNTQSYPSFADENCLGSMWEPLWTWSALYIFSNLLSVQNEVAEKGHKILARSPRPIIFTSWASILCTFLLSYTAHVGKLVMAYRLAVSIAKSVPF